MSKWILAAGAAAIAIATPALADPGGKKGKAGGNDRGPKAGQVERDGNAKSDHQGHAARADRPEKAQRVEVHSRSDDHRFAKHENLAKDVVKGRGNDRIAVRGKDRAEVRRDDRDLVRIVNRRDERRVVRNDFGSRGLIGGCPPGLDKKNNGCLPPGQARKLVGAILPAAYTASMLDGPFRQWYQDNDRYYYRNDGDYIYRVNRDGGLVDALIPYGASDYSYYPVGMNYPGDYNFYNVPDQYRPYYADSDDYLYRYGNNAIYQVDPQTNAIQSIAALLAGDLSVGQAMPSNYSMYNVPLAYRDRYYDSPDAMYRYNDGYIYRADPKTQLITTVIDAIV
jgi:hypothetical protein